MGRNDDAASQSSAGSGSSMGSKMSHKEEDINKNAEGEDEHDILESNQEFTSGVFGVLNCTLNPVKYDYLLRFTVARIILDFVQLLLLVLRPAFGFEINDRLWVWDAIKWVEFANPLTSETYEFYVVWIYVGVAILACSFGVAIWVGWCFKKHEFPVVWPVMLLRLVLNTAVFLFYTSCFSVFLAAFNCNWFMGREQQSEIQSYAGNSTAMGTIYAGNATELFQAGNSTATELVDLRFRMHRFPEVECLELPHIAHGIVAFIACAVFTLVAYAVTLTDFEVNPASRRYMATPHSSVELWALTAKTVMVLNMGIFAGQLYIQSIIMCLATLSLCYLYIRWQPYCNEWVNHIRCGLYCMLFYISAYIAIMKFDHRRDDHGHLKWLTDAMLAGLAPVLVFGFLVSFFRLRLLQWHALKSIRAAPPDVEQHELKDVYRFKDPYEVEIVMRVLRRWTPEDDEVLDPEAVRLADLVIRIGMALFPDDPYIVLVYSNFLISIQDNHQVGTSELQHIKNLDEATLCDRFIVFAREQEILERNKSMTQSSGESTLDLIAYVEFQRTFRLLARTNRDALMALRNFWQLLLHQDVPFARMSAALAAIQKTSSRADKTFKVLLERYPNSSKVYRGYARFLEHIKSDPWTASKYAAVADSMEEEESGNNDALMMRSDGANMLEAVNEKRSAVIVINAEGIMKVANRQTQKLLGYKKSEMEGKNVSMIMPAPFCHRHNGYLRTHISSGKKRILDSVREVVALHKEQYVFPIQLAVTKVSGVGAESIFMGVLRKYEVEPGIIRVWVMPSGAVVSVDDRFTDSFGKSYQDVAGRPVQTLTVHADAIIKLLDKAQAAPEEDFRLGKVSVKGVSFLHKYMDPVEVDITVDLGGSDTQRMLAFNLRPTKPAGKIMVTDARGRLLYNNKDMHEMLGYSAQALSKMDIAQLMPPPYNFLHAMWMREPNAKKPKQSCRSSATVVVLDASGQSIPIRPTITTREVEDTVQHVVQVEPSSWEHGLDERRLVLTLDTDGTVLATSNAASSLFGFRPSELVGQSVACVVDVLAELSAELPAVLSKMARKVTVKPGYSWRVGVHPPDGCDLHNMGPMERLVRARSTQPALMQFLLVAHEDREIPEVKVLLYKADMVSAIIECDPHGLITRPTVSQLDPSGLIFGCSERSMVRRPLRSYLQMPSKNPDVLLQDDKVKKGAMKSGTTGRKVGPLKIMGGHHADGAPLELKVLAVAAGNKHVVIKASFEVLEKGDTTRFLHTLTTQEEARSRRTSMMSQAAGMVEEYRGEGQASRPGAAAAQELEQSKLAAGLALAVSSKTSGAAGEPTKRTSGAGAAPRRVMFAGPQEDALGPDAAVSEAEDEEEDMLDEEAEQLEAVEAAAEAEREEAAAEEAAAEEGTNSEADSEGVAQKLETLDTTDWARGRRLKKLHTLLHTRQARIDFFHFKEQMVWLLGVLLGVHLALFIAFLFITDELRNNVDELDANGRLVVDSQAITISARKIHNLYHGKTHPNVYEMDPEELQSTVDRLALAVDNGERRHHGVYLGFHGLRQLADVYDLLEIWEGNSLSSEQYVDVRMPRLEEDHTNLWNLGNALFASAREVIQNHATIAEQTGNNFNFNRQWSFIINNGPDIIAQAYTRSMNNMLRRDLLQVEEIKTIGIAFLVIELVVIVACIVWCWLLLKGVQTSRHKLLAVFLTIPSGFVKTMALRQMQIAEQDEDGGGGGADDEEDEEAAALMKGQPGAGQPPPPPAQAGNTGARQEKETANARGDMAGKAVVVDVDALVQGQQSRAQGLSNTASGKVKPRWWLKVADLLSEKPIVVGKRKLVPFRRDSFVMLAPLVVWLILVLVINIASIETNEQLQNPIVDNYLSNRLAALTARVIADAHGIASQSTVEQVAEYKDGMEMRLDSMRHMYIALLYGHDPDSRRDMNFINLDGTLFDDKSTQDQFFSFSRCRVKWRPEKYCFDDPDHRFHQVSHNGMDPMMMRLIDEAGLIIAQTDEVTLQAGLGSTRIDYIWNVAWHALAGRQQDMIEFYSQQAFDDFQQAQVPMIVLFALSWVFAAAYVLLLFNPFKAVLNYETRQVGELLSQLPGDMNVESAVAKAVGVEDLVASHTQAALKK